MSTNRLNGKVTSKQELQVALMRLSHIAVAMIAQAGGKVELSEETIQKLGNDQSVTIRTTHNTEQKTLTLEIVKVKEE